MGPFRIHVTATGNGHLAENSLLAICAGGASAAEATEKVRLMALEVFKGSRHEKPPATLIARIDGVRTVAFVMRPFEKPFRMSDGDPETIYFDSSGRNGPPGACA